MFSNITKFLFSSYQPTHEDRIYKKYVRSINEQVWYYENEINTYIVKNGGVFHMEQILKSFPEYKKKKYVHIYGYAFYKVLEIKSCKLSNKYVKEKGFENIIRLYLETENRPYYNVYGHRTTQFNRWLLRQACNELGNNAKNKFSLILNETENDCEREYEEEETNQSS